jgi:ABC-type branched-subunit amino acid transport system ATPase component
LAGRCCLRPKVLLIDEPSIGLSPLVVADVFRLLRKLADQGTTVLMVEQNVKSALKMADDAIALESGRLVLHRPPTNCWPTRTSSACSWAARTSTLLE